MRLIGTLPEEKQARLLGDYLYASGISNEIEAEEPRGWGLWVHDEDRLQEAATILERFRNNPAAAEFRQKARAAEDLRAEEERDLRAWRKRFRASREIFPRQGAYGAGLLTLILIALCGFVAVKTNFKFDSETARALHIAGAPWSHPLAGHLREVAGGEVWRLLTPIFIHLNPVHLICNVLWLFQLGSLLESRLGWLYLLGFVVLTGVGSNLAQYFVSGPRFGGMSGVVYALFGYLWIRGRLQPASGLALDHQTVVLMILWFFVCLFGLVGPIANTAHGVGFLLGMAWGWLDAQRARG